MKKGKAVRDSQAVLSQLMMPNDVNFRGNIFGGVILKMIDAVSFICSTKHAETHCVTAAIDRIIFKEPIQVGEFVVMKASVNFAGKTSMEVGVRVEAHDLVSGKVRHTNSCYVTMVAVAAKGKPKRVSPVIPETNDEKRRFREAQIRREERLKERERYSLSHS